MPNYTIEEIEAMDYITSGKRHNILADPAVKTLTVRCHNCDDIFTFTGTFEELFQGTRYPKPPLECPHCANEELDSIVPDGIDPEYFNDLKQAYLWWLKYKPTPEPNMTIFNFINGGIK